MSQIYHNEEERIAALYQLNILDTEAEEAYDNIVVLAAQICETQMATITFIDKNRVWIKAKVGIELNEIDRGVAFCSATAAQQELFIIPDTLEHSYFCNNILVLHEPYIRFYAGLPLINEDGYTMGHLSIFDTKPKDLNPHQISALRMLAHQVVTLIKSKLQILTLQKIEEELKKSEQEKNEVLHIAQKQKSFYENIFNMLPIDLAVFDANHKYLFVNPGAIKSQEFRNYIIGKDDFEYAAFRNKDTSIAEIRRQQFLEAKNTRKEVRWEDNPIAPDGKVTTHLRRLFPIFDENGELSIVIGFGIDITERKLLEEKQSVLVKQLSVQNTQLVDFCNIVSHNLRGPLVNIGMLVKYIEESEDATEQNLMLSRLKMVIDKLHITFNELVESIQIKQDIEIKSEVIRFDDCLQRTLDELEVQINKVDAVIEKDFEDSPVVIFPPKYLYSIFHNLISNAIKYQAPDRKPIIKISTHKSSQGSIILSVKDNGLGIDLDKHKENIFKIGKVFHRHPNAKGFGLYMTRTQVEAMNGKIWVESEPNIGSTFFIEFNNQI